MENPLLPSSVNATSVAVVVFFFKAKDGQRILALLLIPSLPFSSLILAFSLMLFSFLFPSSLSLRVTRDSLLDQR